MLNEWTSLPYLDFPITSYSTLFSTEWLHLTVVELALFCRSERQGFSSLLIPHNVLTLLAEAEGVGLHSQSLVIFKFRVKLRNGSSQGSQEVLGTVLREVLLSSTSSLLQRGTHGTHLLPFLCQHLEPHLDTPTAVGLKVIYFLIQIVCFSENLFRGNKNNNVNKVYNIYYEVMLEHSGSYMH